MADALSASAWQKDKQYQDVVFYADGDPIISPIIFSALVWDSLTQWTGSSAAGLLRCNRRLPVDRHLVVDLTDAPSRPPPDVVTL